MNTIFQKQIALSMSRMPSFVSRCTDRTMLGLAFALLILGPLKLGVDGCLLFPLASLVMILTSALLVGNSAVSALTEERDKKTLVFLRLTLLSAPQVLMLKLIPEFLMLRSVLLVTAPTVLLVGLLGGAGLGLAVQAIAIAALAGVFAAVSGMFVSTLFPSTSKAIMAGWIFKTVWLLLTPILDMIVGAVLVQPQPPPVFTSLNPLAAYGVLDVPEAFSGIYSSLPWIYEPAILVVTILMFWQSVRRFDMGFIVGNVVADEHIHPVYRNGWGPLWLQRIFPMLKHNPLFLRELATQMRGGAGRWPGYAVFVVLFLAPFVYARLWGARETTMQAVPPPPTSSVTAPAPGHKLSAHPAIIQALETRNEIACEMGGEGCVTSGQWTDMFAPHHTGVGCLRLWLNEVAGVPLPQSMIEQIERNAAFDPANLNSPVPMWHGRSVAELTRKNAPLPHPRALPDEQEQQMTAVNVGLAGAVVLLLLYVAIRASGFTASAVTGERDRRSWEDLTLTGLSPRDAMLGKTMGALLLPLVQMTATFPLMLFFVFSGNLSFFEVFALYLYVAALGLAAAMLGLWSSSISGTSHEAHARALFAGLAGFAVLPLVVTQIGGVLAFAAILMAIVSLGRGERGAAGAWFGLSVPFLVSPSVVSPLSAALSFMPSLSNTDASVLRWASASGGATADPVLSLALGLAALLCLSFILWRQSMCRLSENDRQDVLRTQFPNIVKA